MRTPLSIALIGSLAFALGCGREKALSPLELEAKNRSECQVIAVSQTRFDPMMAEEPARTLSQTQKAGGEVLGSGAVAKGAAKGALVGVVGGAIAAPLPASPAIARAAAR